jgi:hypothetical protein
VGPLLEDPVVYILGGTSVVAGTEDATIKSHGYNVVRLAGSDAYATAVKIDKQITASPSTVVLATSAYALDALSSAAAVGSSWEAGTATLVLTKGDVAHSSIPAESIAYLKSLRPATAAKVADYFFPVALQAAVVPDASPVPLDGEVGAAMIGFDGGPLLWSSPTALSKPTALYLSDNSTELWNLVDVSVGDDFGDWILSAQGDAVSYPGQFTYNRLASELSARHPLTASSSSKAVSGSASSNAEAQIRLLIAASR